MDRDTREIYGMPRCVHRSPQRREAGPAPKDKRATRTVMTEHGAASQRVFTRWSSPFRLTYCMCGLREREGDVAFDHIIGGKVSEILCQGAEIESGIPHRHYKSDLR